MSNVIKFRSADEQCREYMDRVAAKRRRARADRLALECLMRIQRECGADIAGGAFVHLTGAILIEGAKKSFVKVWCRFLAKCIARSVLRRMLTRRPMLH